VSSRGVLGIVMLAALAAAGGGAAASRAPAVTLAGGQVRWFAPGALHTGGLVRCVVNGRSIDVKVAAPGAGASGSDFAWKRGGVSLQIERRPNGATEIACGTTLAPFRRATMPYVIGQNGVGLIRGANRLARVEQLFGRHSASRTVAGTCLAVWRGIGLQATFAGPYCTSNSVLRSATVRRTVWSSLSGVHVGDSVARMQWQLPDAKLVSSPQHRKVWLLATARGSGSQLLAIVGPAGTVAELVCIVR
jgi:hypothetical protein